MTDPAARASAASTRCRNSAAVGEPGQRIGLRLALEPVELEREAGVVGERLEQPQVLVRERDGRAEPVAEDHHAAEPRLAAHRRHERLLDAARGQVAGERLRGALAVDLDGAVVDHGGAQRPGRTLLDRRHRLVAPVGADGRAQRLGVRAQQHELRRTDAEAGACAAQQVEQLALELVAARERVRDAVEELEALVLGPLGRVRPVADEQDRDRRQQQQRGARVGRDDQRAGEREAGVGQRDGQVAAEDARHPPRRDAALGQADRAEDQQRADRGADRDRGERRRPHGRGERLRRREPVQDDRRDARGQRELREVEQQPHRPLAAREHEHDRGAHDRGDHDLARVREQQADDQRQLGDRQRVRAAADVRVDHEHLGGGERGRQRPPGDVHARLVRSEPEDDLEEQHDRRDRRRGDQRSQRGVPQTGVSHQAAPDQRRPDQRRPDQRRPLHSMPP